jgi:transcriptional regulator with XRE-family HTH domain
MKDTETEIGNKLRAYMGEKDLTIEAVAKKLKRNPRTVWAILHGINVPHDRTLYRIKKLIGEIQ